MLSPAPLGSSAWLLYLRWSAVVGQLLTVLAAGLLTSVELPYAPLFACVVLTAITNLAYGAWLKFQTGKQQSQQSEDKNTPFVQSNDSGTNSEDTPNPQFPSISSKTHLGIQSAIEPRSTPIALVQSPALMQHEQTSRVQHSVALTLMLLDLITLTVMLYFSGGAGNPFSFFYFVNLAVGGVMIRPRAAWSLTAVAILGYTLLLFWSMPVEILGARPSSELNLRVTGLMLAFATCSSVVTYFVTRTASQLKDSESELRKTQAARAASQRLQGLTSLAAGAAHELATPLSTIDVIVRELSRHLEGVEKPESVTTDLQLMDAQLEMCKQILQRLRTSAGDSMAQRWDNTTVGDLIDATLEGVRDPHRVEVTDGSDRVENQSLWVPQEALAQAIRNLIHNGLDASDENSKIHVEARIENDSVKILVIDEGEGMSEDVMGRAPDPFFTTKAPGAGIGLGLFLTKNVISQLGGDLVFDSTPGSGTAAIVSIPLQGNRPPTHTR
jgi:two-component system sensor histidine kinase RegB